MKKLYERWVGRPLNRETVSDLFRLAMPALFYFPSYLIWFVWIERHRFSHYAVIHTMLDDHIPFIEAFIIPYYIWFLYISVTLLFFLFSFEVEDYYKNFFFLATGMTIFLVISTLFPNMHHLRPMVMPRDNIFTHLVQIIYASDTPTNLWPSIHVYNSIGSMIALQRSRRVNRTWKVIGHVVGVSIILSTVFVKQHSVYDVLTAFIMAIIFYYLFYHTSLVESFCKKREERVAFRYNG
jgi:membrane-associated phospholipid phosphatase